MFSLLNPGNLASWPDLRRAQCLVMAVFAVGSLAVASIAAVSGDAFLLTIAAIGCTVSALCYLIGRRGHAEEALAFTLCVVTGCVFSSCYQFRGINDVGVSLIPPLILLAGLLVNRRFAFCYATAVVLVAIGIMAARWWGVQPQVFNASEARDLFLFALTCSLSTGIATWLAAEIGQSYRTIRESERRFDELAAQSRTTAWEVDDRGMFTYVSHVSNANWGYRPDEVMGRLYFYDLHPETGREQYKAAYFHGASLLQPFRDIVHTVQRKDGRIAWATTSGIPLLNPDGTLRGYRGSCTDITESKRAQDALQESEDRYRSLFEQSGELILLLDLCDGPPLILDANAAALKAHGYSREEMVGQPVSLLEPDITPQQIEERHRLMAEGKCMFMNRRAKDGRRFEVEVLARQVQIGAHSYVLAVERDITERKRAEEEKANLQLQLAQAQKMESIGRLAGGVAHDFNNLLTVINGYSELALSKTPPADPRFQDLTEVLHAGERAASLVHQLLAFSRRQVLQSEVLDLNATVGDMEKMLRRLVGEDIEVVVRRDPSVPPVLADRHQIEQVIMNLAVNARDAISGVGTLTIETGQKYLEGYCKWCEEQIVPGTYSALTVRDTGAGMDRHTLDHLFEPFFTTKGVGKGTGLGLSMVQGIVNQSGGYVAVESEEGKGSAFHIYLPAATVPEPEPGPVPKATAAGGGETILLVEDQEAVRQLMLTILQEYGYKVVPAHDAHEALRICSAQAVDLLLTDIVMPKMSGVELARRLRLAVPGLRTIFISGYSEGTHEREWGALDGADFLQKPFAPQALAAKVREMLDRR